MEATEFALLLLVLSYVALALLAPPRNAVATCVRMSVLSTAGAFMIRIVADDSDFWLLFVWLAVIFAILSVTAALARLKPQ